MKEEQRLYLVQAKSAFVVYKILNADKSLHHCHALHYLQMATELLGKASGWRDGPVGASHMAVVAFSRRVTSKKKQQKRLGYEGQNEQWEHTLRKFGPIAESLQNIAPALAGDGPNPEYPWPRAPANPIASPVEFEFPIWVELTETGYGRALVALLHKLFDVAEEYM